MQIRRVSFILPLLLCLILAGACRTSPKAADEPTPHETVTAAAWETPETIPASASSADRQEIEEIRRQNREMQKQVAQLTEKVRELKTGSAAESSGAAAPVASSRTAAADDEVIAAIRGAGISDLEVGSNGAGETFVRLPGSLAFGAGKADLMDPARKRLASLSDVLRKTCPDVALRIEGHTDSDPIRKSKWASNQVLSEERAKAVGDYFTGSLGWSPTRVTTRGFGPDRPVATNSTRSGKAQNRRIEIVLVP